MTASTTTTTASTSSTTSSNCPLATPGSTIGMTVSGCRTLASDTAVPGSDAASIWGHVDCAQPSQQLASPQSGGDTHLTGAGADQGNTAYRSLTAFDATTNDSVAPSNDPFSYYGERCELGRNESRGGGYGSTFMLYREGERRVTFMSYRLPTNFPLNQTANHHYNVVMQMKQTQPATNGGGSPMIELDAFGGQWHLEMGALSSPVVWSAPAQINAWTRFAFDVVYSRNSSLGSVTAYADLNGDGSFGPGESSGTIRGATLKTESDGSSIPSHLRAGVYHDIGSDGYSCPSGCSVEMDNVQVLGA